PSVGDPRGFTLTLRHQGQLQLVILPPVAHESRPLLTAPHSLSLRARRSRSGEPCRFLPFRASVPIEGTDCSRLLCPLLTSARWSESLSTPPARFTAQPFQGHRADLPR